MSLLEIDWHEVLHCALFLAGMIAGWVVRWLYAERQR